MAINRECLRAHFEDIRQREGKGGEQYDYVPYEQINTRVIDCTDNEFGWEVLSAKYCEGTKRSKTDYQTKNVTEWVTPDYWLVHGRLTLPELGSRDAFGTAVVEGEDSVKAAMTDAFKRAAVMFGVALELYVKPPQQQNQGRNNQGGNRNNGGGNQNRYPSNDQLSKEQRQRREEHGEPRGSAAADPNAPINQGQVGAIQSICKKNNWAPIEDLNTWTSKEAADWIREHGQNRSRTTQAR